MRQIYVIRCLCLKTYIDFQRTHANVHRAAGGGESDFAEMANSLAICQRKYTERSNSQWQIESSN